MKTNDLVELAGRNLREAVLRNSLTTLGIAVGVASLVAMLSLGTGLQELVSNRFNRSGLFNTVAVFSPRDFRGMDRAERRSLPPAGEIRPLDESARREMERLPNVAEVYPEIRLLTDIGFEGRTLFSSVSALPPSARESDAFENMQGRFFSAPAAEEAILQLDFARDLLETQDLAAGKPADPPPGKAKSGAVQRSTGPLTAQEASRLLGKEILFRYAARQTIEDHADGSDPKNGATKNGGAGSDSSEPGFSVVRREKPLRIVGIIETAPYAGITSGSNSRVFIPVGLAEKLQPVMAGSLRDLMSASPVKTTTYQALVIRVSSPTYVPATQAAVKKMGFSTFSLLDATRNLRRVFAVLDIFLGIFGSVALVVASLGIVNTLVMSVLERRREIGILKALGASDADVKRLFFTEAGAMGIAGGVLGVALGWLIGRGINFGTGIYLKRLDLPPETILAVPWWLAVGAVVFAIVVSLISGLYPAARAARLNPVEALRYE